MINSNVDATYYNQTVLLIPAYYYDNFNQ